MVFVLLLICLYDFVCDDMFAFCVVALGFRVWPVMLCYVAFGVMVFGLCCLDLLVCCVVLLCCVVLRCVALRCVSCCCVALCFN